MFNGSTYLEFIFNHNKHLMIVQYCFTIYYFITYFLNNSHISLFTTDKKYALKIYTTLQRKADLLKSKIN